MRDCNGRYISVIVKNPFGEVLLQENNGLAPLGKHVDSALSYQGIQSLLKKIGLNPTHVVRRWQGETYLQCDSRRIKRFHFAEIIVVRVAHSLLLEGEAPPVWWCKARLKAIPESEFISPIIWRELLQQVGVIPKSI